MKKHCPKVIEEQDKSCREVNHVLEGLLFGKKEKKGYKKSALSSEGAPSDER
jgi:hypothetical protein